MWIEVGPSCWRACNSNTGVWVKKKQACHFPREIWLSCSFSEKILRASAAFSTTMSPGAGLGIAVAGGWANGESPIPCPVLSLPVKWGGMHGRTCLLLASGVNGFLFCLLLLRSVSKGNSEAHHVRRPLLQRKGIAALFLKASSPHKLSDFLGRVCSGHQLSLIVRELLWVNSFEM